MEGIHEIKATTTIEEDIHDIRNMIQKIDNKLSGSTAINYGVIVFLAMLAILLICTYVFKWII